MQIAKAAGSALALLLLSPMGCSHAGEAGEAVRPKAKTAAEAMGGEVACADAAHKALTPLVVDLSGADRLDLEAQMQQGVAIVSYTCDGMRLLSGCTVAGEYSFVGVSMKEESFQLASADEVAANIPFSGANVSAGMNRDQSLDLAVLMVGKKTTPLGAVYSQELVGACEGATHSIRAATIGAFAMKTGTKGKVQAAADIFGSSASSASSSSENKATKDGDPASCKSANVESPTPPAQCGALVRIELMPIQPGSPPSRASGGNEPEAVTAVASTCPTGFVMQQGKCTQDTEDGAHLCSASNLDDCMAQCQAGNADSCFNAAVETRDRTRSEELMDKACSGGSMLACAEIGIRLTGTPGDPPRAKKLLGAACEAGVARACSQLGAVGTQVGLTGAQSVKLLQRACLLGEPVPCEWAAQALLGKDVPEAQDMLGKSCMAGNGDSCAKAVPLYMGEKVEGAGTAGKKDEDRARQLALRGCYLGYASLCTRAKRLLGSDSDETVEVLRAGCYKGNPRANADAVMQSCGELHMSAQRSGDEEDRIKAMGVLCSVRRGGRGCNAYERASLEHAVSMLREACYNGNAQACLDAPLRQQEASCWQQVEYGDALKTPESELSCEALRARDPARLRYFYQLKCSEAEPGKANLAEKTACGAARKL